MSRHLPEQPNLEHLKKQAKDLLPTLQQQNPAAKLADAQHALAREYGFASWPKLKAQVEAATLSKAIALTPSAESNPLIGTWKASLSQSKQHPLNQFQSATLQFEVSGDVVTITHVGVDGAGREERGKHTLHADGLARVQANGYVVIAGWRDPHVLETRAQKGGQEVGWGTYEVSADGQTLTVSGDEQVIVFEKAS